MIKVNGGIITNYGADIIAPVMLYYLSRKDKTVFSNFFKKGLNEKQAFILIWILCIAWEVLQKFDLSGTPLVITRGTFDPMDILVYTLTLLICYYFDVTRIQDVATAIPR